MIFLLIFSLAGLVIGGLGLAAHINLLGRVSNLEDDSPIDHTLLLTQMDDRTITTASSVRDLADRVEHLESR